MVYATVITIGDEILIGQIVDTNSVFIAQELTKIGIALKWKLSVADDKGEIIKALNHAASDSDIIIITGGLGPTADDVTKPVLCEYFGGKMIEDAATVKHLQILFEQKLNRPLTDRNRKQAEVPDNCTVLQNDYGTAPGMLFEKDGKYFFSLPGVPHEMKGLMQDAVLPFVQKRFIPQAINHRTLVVFGIPESNLADHLVEFEKDLPANIHLAYLPNFGMIRLRLTGSDKSEKNLVFAMDSNISKLKNAVNEWLIAEADLPMEAIVGQLLRSKNKTMCTAESCTGGNIAKLVTSVPGSSAYFQGSVVSYSNEVKENLLQVPIDVIENNGAVSEETVQFMAKNARKILNTDYAIAVSGIMGPDGGSVDKPVGTVWMAVANNKQTITKKMNLRFDRLRNIDITSAQALNLLREMIVADDAV